MKVSSIQKYSTVTVLRICLIYCFFFRKLYIDLNWELWFINSHTQNTKWHNLWSSRKAWLLITIFANHSPFLLPPFFRREEKRGKNIQGLGQKSCLAAWSQFTCLWYCQEQIIIRRIKLGIIFWLNKLP